MTDASSRATARWPSIVSIAGLLTCCVVVAFVPPMWDHAYQSYIAARVLDGAGLYVDVAAADMHPPLVTWMMVGLEAIGRVFGTNSLALVGGFTGVLIVASISLCGTIGPRDPFLLGALTIALVPLAGSSFGQGEHLAVISALPYVAAAFRASTGQRIGWRMGVPVGLLAGLGLSMKPHFVLVFLLVEAVVALRYGWRTVRRSETVTIILVFVLYLAATAVITPEFFGLVPWIVRLYSGYSPTPRSQLILSPETGVLLITAIAGFVVTRGEWRRLNDLLTAMAVAMYVAVIVQGKGWDYHWYPVLATCMCVVAVAVRSRVRGAYLAIPVLAFVSVGGAAAQVDGVERVLSQPPTYLPDMLAVVERHAAGRPIVALTPVLSVAFPLVNLTGLEWSSPYGHLWMIPGFYPGIADGRSEVRYRATGRWVSRENEMFDRLWTAIEQSRPGLIILQSSLNGRFDMRAYLETDPRFGAYLAETSAVDTVGPYAILVHR